MLDCRPASLESHSMNDVELQLIEALKRKEFTDVCGLVKEMVGLEVRIWGYLCRNRSIYKADFVVSDPYGATVQCVSPEGRHINGFLNQLNLDSIVEVTGVVSLPTVPLTQITTTQQVEIKVRNVICVKKPSLLATRVEVDIQKSLQAMEPRVKQAILAIQFQVEHAFREFLTSKHFVGIHTPSSFVADSIEGVSASAFLAPQIHKQMAICGGFSRVFEVGTCFTSQEDSPARPHLIEFIGLDVGMQINIHYSELMDLLDQLFVFIFTHVNKKCIKELETVGTQYPFKPLKFLPKTLKLTFAQGVQILKEAGVEVDPLQDLNTESKRKLCQLILEKYKTEFFILHHCHLAGRPFYTMPCADDSTYSNSFDVFIRGDEIVSGAQHIHDAKLLEKRAKECGIDVETLSSYIDSFRFGTPPHGGFGAGLERLVKLFCALN